MYDSERVRISLFEELTESTAKIRQEIDDAGILVLKVPAGCTGKLQPCDLCVIFREMKRTVKQYDAKDMKQMYPNVHDRLVKLWPSGKVNDEDDEEILTKQRKSAVSSSKKLDITCLLVLKTALSTAMTPRRIQDGFRISGICPVSHANMFGQCTTKCHNSVVTSFTNELPDLVKQFVVDGHIHDQYISNFKFVSYPDDAKSQASEDKITMRQRAVLLNGDGWKTWKLSMIKKKEQKLQHKQDRKDMADVNAAANKKLQVELDYYKMMTKEYAALMKAGNGDIVPITMETHKKRKEEGDVIIRKRKCTEGTKVIKTKVKKREQRKHEAVESCNVNGACSGTALNYCGKCHIVNWCNKAVCKKTSKEHILNCGKSGEM
jgi:hypothetical protein